MKLIADAGATKTLWYLCNEQSVVFNCSSSGCNPNTMTAIQIETRLREDWLPAFSIPPTDIQTIHFYGAGCGSDTAKSTLNTLFRQFFPQATNIEIETDLLAAARAVCPKEQSICCILGTGSNSCIFDGNQIMAQVPSLGYLLGDEGGGADMGKRLLQAYFYNEMPETLGLAFQKAYPDFNREVLLERIYKQPAVSAYLASFVPFIKAHIQHPFIEKIVEQSLSQFLEKHLGYYTHFAGLPLYFVGSIAHAFSEQLYRLAHQKKLTIKKILAAPFPTLLNFHINT